MLLTVHPKARTVQISEDTRQYLEKKLSKLNRHFRHEPEALFTLNFERGQHIAEITLTGDGVLLRGQERSGDVRAAIDSVLHKLETQITRYKGKRVASRNHSHAPCSLHELPLQPTLAETPDDSDETEFAPRIVRRKTFSLKPMTPEEAAQQMELLGHDFFVFHDQETRQVGVLYRRASGDYGLIEPEG